MNLWFKEYEDFERRKIFACMSACTPGSEEYKMLQEALYEYELIDEKRRQGKLTQTDVMKILAMSAALWLALNADMLIPALGGKLKITEFALRFLKP